MSGVRVASIVDDCHAEFDDVADCHGDRELPPSFAGLPHEPSDRAGGRVVPQRGNPAATDTHWRVEVGDLDQASAGAMSLLLLVISLVTIAVSYGLMERLMRRRRTA